MQHRTTNESPSSTEDHVSDSTLAHTHVLNADQKLESSSYNRHVVLVGGDEIDDFIWQVEVQTLPKSNQFRAIATHSHPTRTDLNQKVSQALVSHLLNDDKNQTDTQSSPSILGRYSIELSHSPRLLHPPIFDQSNQYIQTLCHLPKIIKRRMRAPRYLEDQNAFSFNVRLSITRSGHITEVTDLNPSRLNRLNYLLSKEIKTAQYYPYINADHSQILRIERTFNYQCENS